MALLKPPRYQLNNPDLIFTIPTPPSVNQAYTNVPKVGRVKTKRYRDWEKDASNYLLINKDIQTIVLNPPYGVVYSINKLDNRVRDCANYEKCLTDYLVHIKIISKDELIDVNTQQWITQKDLGAITICELFSEVKTL